MTLNLNKLIKGMSLTQRLFRFFGIGMLSSLIYVLAVSVYVEALAVAPKWASIFAYLTALPISFLGHRKITFRSEGSVIPELARFLILHVANMSISVIGMIWVVDWLQYDYWFGSLTAVLFVPLMTFIVMNFWVFMRTKPHKTET